MFPKCEFFRKSLDIVDIRYYNINTECRYSIMGGDNTMPRAKFQTLTEQMYYILLCLSSECYGMDIMDKVPQMTNGRVKVGSGTLYNLLEQFLDADMIKETKAEGRRRCYILTDKGRELLDNEYKRLNSLVSDYQRLMGKEDPQ